MALPTDITSLNYAFLGSPYVDVPARSDLSSDGSGLTLGQLDIADLGMPFGGIGRYFAVLKRWTGSVWQRCPLEVRKSTPSTAWYHAMFKYWEVDQWKWIDTFGTKF